MKKNSLLFLVLFSIVFHYCEAQSTKIKGKIVNESNEPMPFVNIKFRNSNVGTVTDFDGKYSLETKWATDILEGFFFGLHYSFKKRYKKQVSIHKLSTAILISKTSRCKHR